MAGRQVTNLGLTFTTVLLCNVGAAALPYGLRFRQAFSPDLPKLITVLKNVFCVFSAFLLLLSVSIPQGPSAAYVDLANAALNGVQSDNFILLDLDFRCQYLLVLIDLVLLVCSFRDDDTRLV